LQIWCGVALLVCMNTDFSSSHSFFKSTPSSPPQPLHTPTPPASLCLPTILLRCELAVLLLALLCCSRHTHCCATKSNRPISNRPPPQPRCPLCFLVHTGWSPPRSSSKASVAPRNFTSNWPAIYVANFTSSWPAIYVANFTSSWPVIYVANFTSSWPAIYVAISQIAGQQYMSRFHK
jgi:hypothetical protein